MVGRGSLRLRRQPPGCDGLAGDPTVGVLRPLLEISLQCSRVPWRHGVMAVSARTPCSGAVCSCVGPVCMPVCMHGLGGGGGCAVRLIGTMVLCAYIVGDLPSALLLVHRVRARLPKRIIADPFVLANPSVPEPPNTTVM